MSNLARSLGRQRSGTPRDQARESLRRLMTIAYDEGSSLSDQSRNFLEGEIGGLIDVAEVRIIRVLILEDKHNLYYKAKRYGGEDGKVPISGVAEDYFEITGGSKFGSGEQYMAHGKINSTGQEATLFIDPNDDQVKELVVYLEEESS